MTDYLARQQALTVIAEERHRQDVLKREGRFRFTCADPEMTHFERYAVLGEEFGEVGRAALEAHALVYDGQTPAEAVDRLRMELAQVAAVALAWLEGLA